MGGDLRFGSLAWWGWRQAEASPDGAMGAQVARAAGAAGMVEVNPSRL
jgi:hypothetical protein